MSVRTAEAVWEGSLKSGHGNLKVESRAFEAGYSYATRFGAGKDGTNPEELIGAAHAGCFSMALSHALTEAGHPPKVIRTEARVHLEKTGDGFAIPTIELRTSGVVPGIEEAAFLKLAEKAKDTCPVSKLFVASITLDARLDR
jgi:lipoyl-dependent peroxiredoxin